MGHSTRPAGCSPLVPSKAGPVQEAELVSLINVPKVSGKTSRFSLAIGTLRRSAVEAARKPVTERMRRWRAHRPAIRGGHRSRPSHSTGTHPPQLGAGTHGAAALAVTGPPLSRWTQPCACRFALYWLRAATRASPAASTTSVDDARTATLRPGSSTSSSTSPTASLPGPTE